jgi:hypothetical protein
MGGATEAQGDANADGNVTAADLGIWQQQYGTAPALSAAVGVLPTSESLSDKSESLALQAAFGLLLDEAPQTSPIPGESVQQAAHEAVFDISQSPWGFADSLGLQLPAEDPTSRLDSNGSADSDLIDSVFADSELSPLESEFLEAIR